MEKVIFTLFSANRTPVARLDSRYQKSPTFRVPRSFFEITPVLQQQLKPSGPSLPMPVLPQTNSQMNDMQLLHRWQKMKKEIDQSEIDQSFRHSRQKAEHKSRLLHAQPSQHNDTEGRSCSSEPETTKTGFHSDHNRKQRATSEEPDTKKRSLYQVDTEELMLKSEVRSGEAASAASSAMIANLCLVQKNFSTTLNDKTFKEAFSLQQPETLSFGEQVTAWDKAKESAARDAPRPQLEERGPHAQIRQYRDEHARKQQEADEVYRKQLPQVESRSEEDSMGRIPAGFMPTNRLGKQEPKRNWLEPKANADAGRHNLQSMTEPPHKRQRFEPPNSTSTEPTSNVEDTSYGQERQSSSAKSAHSQTMKAAAKNGYGGMRGTVKEFRTVEDTVNPKFSKAQKKEQRRNGNPNPPYRPPTSTIIRLGDLDEDPIDDSDMEVPHLPQKPQKRSKLQVEIPVGGSKQLSTNDARQRNPQHGQLSSPDLEGPTTSSYFPMNSTSSKIVRPARGHQAVKNALAAQALHTSSQPIRRFGDQTTEQEDDDSLDELATNELIGIDPATSPRGIAEKLLEGRKSNQGRSRIRYEPAVELDESDDNGDASHADIVPTIFKGSKWRPTSTADKPVYGIRQLFSPAKICLLHTKNIVWWLEHNRDKNFFQFFDTQGGNQNQIITKNMDAIDFHEDSCKVIIHNKHVHQSGKSTIICIEFIDQKTCHEFADDMLRTYEVTRKPPHDAPWLDRVFLNQLDIIQKREQVMKPKPKDLPDDVRLAMAKSQRRLDPLLNNAQLNKTNGSIDRPSQRINEAARKTRGMAASMTSNSVVEHESASRQSRRREVPSESFYGKSSPAASNELTHETRSSTRKTNTRAIAPKPAPRPRSPSPEVVRWTKDNPNWAKEYDWRKSIVYPPTTKNRTTIEKDDIERLDNGEFLNDSLIGFYLGKLEVELQKANPETAKRIYFQNSFFYQQLSKPVKGNKSGINYLAVEKWTSKVDLFKYDYIIVPVNESFHWYVAIICHPKKLIEMAEMDGFVNNEEGSTEPAKSGESSDLAGGAVNGPPDRSVTSDSGLTPQTKSISLGESLNVINGEAALGYPKEGSGAADRRDDSSPPPVMSDLLSGPTESSAKRGRKKTQPPPPKSPSDFRIITLDSFHLTRTPCCTRLKKYLVQELKAKKGIDAEVPPNTSNLPAKNIPPQNNSSDCGLFLLSYIEQFIQNPEDFVEDMLKDKDEYTEKDYPQASYMREYLRDLLFKIQSEQNGGKMPKQTCTQSKYALKAKEKAAINAKPSQPTPRPATRSITISEDGVAKPAQKVLSSIETKEANSVITPDDASDKDVPEITKPQKSVINSAYESIVGRITFGKNSMLGKPRAESSSSDQAVQRPNVIRIDDSTQGSHPPKGSDSRRKEIADSQSSETSSMAKEASSMHDSTDAHEAIVITDSPEIVKPVPKSVFSAAALESAKSKPPRAPTLQVTAGSRKLRISSSEIDYPPQAGSPPSEPEPEHASHDSGDDVDLVNPFSVPQADDKGPMADELDDDMLLDVYESATISGTRDNPEMLSPPTSKPPNVETNNATESARSSHASTQQVLEPQPTRGKKRKSFSVNDDDGKLEDPVPHSHVSKTSDEPVITGSNAIRKRQKHTEIRGGKGHPVEVDDEPIATSSREKRKRSVGMTNTPARSPSALHRDPLEIVMSAAMLRRSQQDRRHTKFPA